MCCGVVKLKRAEPKGLEVTPYEIIVPLDCTNTSPPAIYTNGLYCLYIIVWYTTVPVVFVHWNTGEFPGSPAAYVPGVFIAATKLDTHLSYV